MPNGTLCEFITGDKGRSADKALIVPLCLKPEPPMQIVARADALAAGAVAALLRVGALRDDPGALAHAAPADAAFQRVIVLGLGETERLDGSRIRAAAGAAMRWLVAEKIDRAALWIDGLVASPIDHALGDWACGMALAGFRFSEHKSENNAAPPRVTVRLLSAEPRRAAAAMPDAAYALTVAGAVNFARSVAHQPPNVINPQTLAQTARKMGAAPLKCTILGEAELRKRRMGGILSVGQSALHPPCLIQIEYRPLPRARATTVLVGKAVTFDTGGYSIKPAQGMEAMKFDKCGGMAVLGVMKAVAALKLKCNVVGLIAAAENAISERAYRPADIIRMMSGKTVEIISTDAEGRMLLGDALWYAQQEFKPTALIDLATLTGGVGVALGKLAAGIMSNDDNLAGELEESGRRTHERLWRLPLWDEYRDLIKGTDSDIRNSAGVRDAHAIVGGMFLREFVKSDVPWAHLDIAAVASQESADPPLGKGATGFGIRLLIDFLSRRAM